MKILKIREVSGIKKVNAFVFNLFVVLCLFVLLIPTAKKYSQSLKFVDEDEYITNAFLMNEKGYKLYDSISTNHQPVPYLMSMVVQKIGQPVDVFQLITWHRVMIVVWSLGFSVLLVFRFGRKALPFIVIFESIKYFTLGNEFVGESLAAYPLVYWMMSFFELMVDDEFYLEDLLLGILSSLIVLLMLPMGLPLFVLTLLRYYFSKGKGLVKYLLGTLIPLGVVFLFVSPGDYYRETILNNFSYAIPIISEVKSVSDFFKLFTLPIQTYFSGRNIFNNWISFISFFWWWSILIAVAKRKSKLVLSWIILFVLWGLTNTRNLVPNVIHYEAFHLTPWLAVGISMATLLFRKTWRIAPVRAFMVNGLSLLVLIYLFFNSGMPWREKIDPVYQHYVGYTNAVNMGRVFELLSDENSRLMVVPQEALLHWTSKVGLATRQVTYYEWHYHVPELASDYNQVMESNPPDLVFFDESKTSYDVPLKMILEEKYTPIKTVVGISTQGYVLNSFGELLDEETISRLNNLGYEF